MNLSSEILIPEPEVVATSELKVDGKNPNKMSREQHDRLKVSIKKFGFIVPIITTTLYKWGPLGMWWGRWDLNPGSLAPQASILIHARRRPHKLRRSLGLWGFSIRI